MLDIFCLSLRNGIFPDLWKLNYIIPLHKNGDTSDVNNYRPICKSNVFAKLLDSIVTENLTSFVSKHIIDEQHGFLKNRSTITNLSIYIEHLVESLSNKKCVDSVYTDFCRAFDMVNKDLLIRKLAAYGVNGRLLNWFDSFLSNRKQVVLIKGCLSEPIDVISGVGQGTHSSPLFFLIFINDIKFFIKFCKFLLFADDMKLYREISEPLDTQLLQNDLDSFYLWCKSNGLECNTKKCFSIRFGKSHIPALDYSINNVNIVNVSHIRDLGIIFDEKLSFNNHIDYIKTTVIKRINFIKRFTKHFNKIESFRTLYYSFVYPNLIYGSVIWRPYLSYQTKSLEQLNHRFLRYTAYRIGKPMSWTNHDYTDISKLLFIPSIESAWIRQDIIFAFKLINNLIDNSELLSKFNFFVPSRTLRNNNFYFYTPAITTDLSLHSVSFRISTLCNANSNWLDLYNSTLYSLKTRSFQLYRYE